MGLSYLGAESSFSEVAFSFTSASWWCSFAVISRLTAWSTSAKSFYATTRLLRGTRDTPPTRFGAAGLADGERFAGWKNCKVFSYDSVELAHCLVPLRFSVKRLSMNLLARLLLMLIERRGSESWLVGHGERCMLLRILFRFSFILCVNQYFYLNLC